MLKYRVKEEDGYLYFQVLEQSKEFTEWLYYNPQIIDNVKGTGCQCLVRCFDEDRKPFLAFSAHCLQIWLRSIDSTRNFSIVGCYSGTGHNHHVLQDVLVSALETVYDTFLNTELRKHEEIEIKPIKLLDGEEFTLCNSDCSLNLRNEIVELLESTVKVAQSYIDKDKDFLCQFKNLKIKAEEMKMTLVLNNQGDSDSYVAKFIE